MGKLDNFNMNTEDRILDKILKPYYSFFTMKELIEGNDSIKDKIKFFTISEFLDLQRTLLKQKTFITLQGHSITYVSILEIFKMYSFLEYEQNKIGRYSRIAKSFKEIEKISTKFIELNSSIFEEIKETHSLSLSFYETNLDDILFHYKEKKIQCDSIQLDYLKKADHYLSSFQENWDSMSIADLISLKKESYHLAQLDLYVS